VPTLRELGFTDPLYDTSVWMAVLVPAKTPAAVVQNSQLKSEPSPTTRT
jgi:tripartite-type tricarboxylate transporter receptor subunit TctC